MFGEKNTTKMREKEGVPQGTALLPACERGCPWLAACQLCLHHWCQWIKSKVSKYAPKKDTKHLQWGLDCTGCPVQCPCIDGLSSATGHFQPPLQHLPPSWKKDLALLNTQTKHFFCGSLRARIHPANFAGGLEKQADILK